MTVAPDRLSQLTTLNELLKELLRGEGWDRLLDTVMSRALPLFGAQRGFIAVPEGDRLDFRVVSNWSRDELESGRETVSGSILEEVLARREPLLVSDALTDPRFGDKKSVRRLQIRSVLAAPIEDDDRLLAVIYLETTDLDQLFGDEDLEVFRELLEAVGRSLQTGLRMLLLERRASRLERDLDARYQFPGIVTGDQKLRQILETAAQVAGTDLPVLIQGPSGTGKELVARAVHRNSRRSNAPMLTFNCGAIAPSLVESELFGHKKGAFTGASQDKKGVVAAAHGGTLFLDEVGEIPLELQAKLLRTVQFGEVKPLGDPAAAQVDVRFVAATNRDLEQAVAERTFREDLYFRLNAVTLHIPPLSERPGDVLLLFRHFLDREASASGRPVPEPSRELERVIASHDWPGNVRELENEVRRLLAVSPTGVPLTPDRLSERIRRLRADEGLSPLETQERELIRSYLAAEGGNRSATAKVLGISRETLRKKLKQYQLDG